MKHCPSCTLEFPDTSRFCKSCGGELRDDEITIQVEPIQPNTPVIPNSSALTCQNCGKPHREGASFCKGCGQPLSTRNAYHLAGKVNEKPFVQSRASVPISPHVTQLPVNPNNQAIACTKCGSWNSSGLKFCESCGAPLGLDLEKRRTTGKRTILIGSAISAVVLLTLLLAGWYFRGVDVMVISDPPGARVLIDGEEVAQTSLTDGRASIPHLRRGPHTVRLEREGFEAWSQTFELGLTDFSRTIEAKLNANAFTLTIITVPTASKVLLDKKDVGATDDNKGELVLQNVTHGKHDLSISHEGYVDWNQTVSLESANVIRVELTSLVINSNDSPTESSSARSEIMNVLNGWAQSIRDRDIDSHMQYYTDVLDTYYHRSNVSAEKVRSDRMSAFSKYSSFDIQLNNINIMLDSSGERATVTFDKTFDFRGSEKNFSGSVQNELMLVKVDGGWRILGEIELQIYYVNK